tara:strand:+ start:17 stop:487 length:471 start_codon:yes stop_codon:yes gene_type:complete
MKELYNLNQEQLSLLTAVKADFRGEILTNCLYNNIIKKYHSGELEIQDLEFYLNTVIKSKINQYNISTLQKVCYRNHLNPLAKPVIEEIIDGLECQVLMHEEMGINNIPKISPFEIWLIFLTNDKKLSSEQIHQTESLINSVYIDEVNNINSHRYK